MLHCTGKEIAGWLLSVRLCYMAQLCNVQTAAVEHNLTDELYMYSCFTVAPYDKRHWVIYECVRCMCI